MKMARFKLKQQQKEMQVTEGRVGGRSGGGGSGGRHRWERKDKYPDSAGHNTLK